jgi:hypothetical protein
MTLISTLVELSEVKKIILNKNLQAKKHAPAAMKLPTRREKEGYLQKNIFLNKNIIIDLVGLSHSSFGESERVTRKASNFGFRY